MKIVFLNIWNAKIREEVEEFIKNESQDTDVFCLQEVFDDATNITTGLLTNYEIISARKFVRKEFNFAQATFIRKDIEILTTKILFEKQETGLGIYTQIKLKNKIYNICNFHGMPQPGDKLDTVERIKQSKELIEFFSKIDTNKIIGGDFNLYSETESVKLFNKNGYANLINEFKIDTTRNQLAWNKYPDNKQLFADYVFTSPDINIKKFIVPKNEISDHLPLILELA